MGKYEKKTLSCFKLVYNLGNQFRESGPRGGGAVKFCNFCKILKSTFGVNEKKTHSKFHRDQMNGNWFKEKKNLRLVLGIFD